MCFQKFLFMWCIFQDNYNKKIAPFSFDKINNVNIPVNINVSMSVIDIIKIAEVGGAGGGLFSLFLVRLKSSN